MIAKFYICNREYFSPCLCDPASSGTANCGITTPAKMRNRNDIWVDMSTTYALVHLCSYAPFFEGRRDFLVPIPLTEILAMKERK